MHPLETNPPSETPGESYIQVENWDGKQVLTAKVTKNPDGEFTTHIQIGKYVAEGKSRKSAEEAVGAALKILTLKIKSQTGKELMWVAKVDLGDLTKESAE